MARTPIKISMDELCRNCKAYSSRGLKTKHMAAQLGVSERWLYAKKAKSKKLRDAIEQGKALSVGRVVNQLYQDAISPGNLPAKIFFLCNTDPDNWQNTHHQRVSGPKGEPLTPQQDHKPADYDAAIADIDKRFS